MADVVLYDGLANTRLLDMAPGAECISVGKHGQTRIWTQDEINRCLIEFAQQGKTVVRLKGGDPAVFARTAEELEVIAASGLDFEVVPGITAALAAASYTGIPITHRDHASAVAFVTGQQQVGSSQDWKAMAGFPGTLVFYMGVTTAKEWTRQLMQYGKSPETPAAIIRRCTWSDQTIIRCLLREVGEHLTPATKLRPPVLVIVGEVAALGENFSWFQRRPLRGCGILLTRPEQQNELLCSRLTSLGASVYVQPSIEIMPPEDPSSLQKGLDLVDGKKIEGVTFSSVNAVNGFFDALMARGLDARSLCGCTLAAVGKATADRLQHFGCRADVLPTDDLGYSAAALLETLGAEVAGQHWIVTNTNRSRDVLESGLTAAGATVTPVRTYETQPVQKLRPSVTEALKRNQINFCTITSSAVAEAAYEMLGEFRSQISPISLSENASSRLSQLQWPAVVTASNHTSEALVEAILDACGKT